MKRRIKKIKKTHAKELKEKVWQGAKGDPLKIVQKIKICQNYRMVYVVTYQKVTE